MQQRQWQLVVLINEYEGHIYLCHIILTNLRTSLQLRIDCSHQLRAVDRPYREDSEGHSPLGAGDVIVTWSRSFEKLRYLLFWMG